MDRIPLPKRAGGSRMMTMKEGTKLGRYEIRSLIGGGGMGEAHLVFNQKISLGTNINIEYST